MNGWTPPHHAPASLDGIRSRLDLLRQVEAEHGFGVVLDAPEAPASVIPELPGAVGEGLAGVFSLIERLEGTYFRFQRPNEAAGPDAWAGRRQLPECPMGNPLTIGVELLSTAKSPEMWEYGERLVMDVDDGVVYFLNSDDYVWLCRTPDDDTVEFPDLAPDLVTFFHEIMLGPGYPLLVDTVLGPKARTARNRRRAYKDTWLRLLIAAGLLPAADAAAVPDETPG